jgi:hypothetical protein
MLVISHIRETLTKFGKNNYTWSIFAFRDIQISLKYETALIGIQHDSRLIKQVK